MKNEKHLIIQALKMHHDAHFTPGLYEHSIYGKAALLLETSDDNCAGAKAEVGTPDIEGICPVCGEQIRYGCFELVDEGGFYSWGCPNCGASGKEGYDLIFDGNQYDVHLADGTPFERTKGE